MSGRIVQSVVEANLARQAEALQEALQQRTQQVQQMDVQNQLLLRALMVRLMKPLVAAPTLTGFRGWLWRRLGGKAVDERMLQHVPGQPVIDATLEEQEKAVGTGFSFTRTGDGHIRIWLLVTDADKTAAEAAQKEIHDRAALAKAEAEAKGDSRIIIPS